MMRFKPLGSTPTDTTDFPNPIRVDLGVIEQRAPQSLRFYEKNPRSHPEVQIARLMASIRSFGFILPVLVDDESVIVVGAARVSAALRLGLPTIPTLCLDHLTPAQIRQYRIADNKLGELSSWDMEVLAEELRGIVAFDDIEMVETMGFDIPEVEVLLDGVTDPHDNDSADEDMVPPVVPVSRPGDLWVMGDHRLICGSSLEPDVWTHLMNDGVARMAITDAPFNVPIAGHVSGLGKIKHAEFAMASGEMSETEFVAFLQTALACMCAHLVDGAVIQAFMDWRHLYNLETATRALDLSKINLAVWNKTNAGMGSLYRSKHELVLIVKKGKAPHINNVQLGKYGRYRANVWDFAGVNSFGKTRDADLACHPTVKPIAMIAEAIRDVSHKGDIVLDAFMGSGTTILAAERSGRKGYGVEIDPAYVDVAIMRWEKMTGGQAILAGDGRSFARVAADRQTEAQKTSVEFAVSSTDDGSTSDRIHPPALIATA